MKKVFNIFLSLILLLFTTSCGDFDEEAMIVANNNILQDTTVNSTNGSADLETSNSADYQSTIQSETTVISNSDKHKNIEIIETNTMSKTNNSKTNEADPESTFETFFASNKLDSQELETKVSETLNSTEGRITSERTATTESSSSSIQKSTEPTSQQIQTQEVLNRKNYVSNLNEITNVYSAEEIIDYIDYCSGPNAITFLYLLDEKYPIEYFVRPAGASPYCVYKVDEGEKLFVFFNENEESLRDVTYFFLEKEHLTQEAFAGISSGSTLADVETIDRGTQFIDSVNAYSLSKGFTLHMVDGGFIKITYEGGDFNYRSSKPENPSDFIVKEVSFVPNGEALDIPRIFGDGPVHYTIIEYD